MGKIQIVEGRVQLPVKRPPAGTEVNIAADIASTKWVYGVRWEGEERYRFSTPSGLEHLQALLQRFEGCPIRFAYEACGFGYEAAWLLQERAVEVTVIAPSRMERAPGLQVKTDRNDVGKMVRKLELRDLKGIYIPSRIEHERRQLVRTYGQAIKERKRAQTRIRSLFQEHGLRGPAPSLGWAPYALWLQEQHLAEPVKLCVEALLALRTMADVQVKRLRAQLLILARHQDYDAIVEALCEHPGVGPLSAIRLVLELMDINRFRTAESIGHYLGLTPSEYSTGLSVERGAILKRGPGSLRAAMLQCGWASVRRGGDPELRAMFMRLLPRTGKKRAVVAVTRRLVTRLRAKWRQALHDKSSPAS
jgi:transposase